MLTVSAIAQSLSNGPHPPSTATSEPHNYCIYCGVALSNALRGIVKTPLHCPVDLTMAHEWRACQECNNIAASLYYYAGAGRSHFPGAKLRGAALDVYVWILRESPQDEWTAVSIPLAARSLRYSRAAIAAALARLRTRGLLEKRTRHGRYGEYRPLIWQRPKGE